MYSENMVRLAMTFEGVNASDPRYLDLIAANETAIMRASMALMSSCALVVRGLWRAIGVKHSILESAYIVGHAVSDVIQIASSANAFISIDEARPGSVVVVDEDRPDAHVYTIVEITPGTPGDYAITSIDGGQRIAGIEGILRVTRAAITGLDHRLTPPQSVRRITHVIDTDRLMFS